VASNLNTSPSILSILFRDDEVSVRMAVATNSKTPLRVMEKFSVDSDEAFRIAIASNPGDSAAILLGMIFDTDPVKVAAAEHPNMPAAGLEQLSGESLLAVRQAVVNNPNSPPGALRKLSFDADKQLKRIARTKLAAILEKEIELDRER